MRGGRRESDAYGTLVIYDEAQMGYLRAIFMDSNGDKRPESPINVTRCVSA